jgi:hypothetical protein
MRFHRFKSIVRSVFALCALLELASVVLAQSGGLALTHVTIIDSGVGKPQQDMTILVRGHDIAAVGRAKQVTIPASVKVIDGTGKFVIPGLWDMHSGGVDTDELSAKTMEARKVPGLFFIGEVVDVTGHLGGYNFQWAWASGAAAGRAL